MSAEEPVALVTGAGRGIGRSIAIELARRGMRLVLNDLDESALAGVLEEVRMLGRQARACAGDIGDPRTGEAMVAAAVEAFGGVHVLVNNAGRMQQAPFLEMTLDQAESV